MSSSYSCELELKKLAEELHKQAYELESAADVLETIRTSSDLQDSLQDRVKLAKAWAKTWMERIK